MLDYPLLKALLAVEREGTFEGASRSLGITSSAVSQRIRLLEERVGAVLVHRSPTHPSDVGQLLCRHAEKVMLLEQDLVSASSQQLQGLSHAPSTIKIAVNDDSLSSWFLEALKPDDSDEHQFYFEISIADQDHSIKQMMAGEVLAAISCNKQPAQGFRSYPLGKHLYRATASPDFMARYFGDQVTIEALEIAPSLRYSSRDDLQKQWVRQVFKTTCELPYYTVPSSYCFVDACLKNIAWGMHPALMVDHHIQSGALVDLVDGQTLAKPLYWHVSRIVEGTLSDVTDRVRRAARKYLIQDIQPVLLKKRV